MLPRHEALRQGCAAELEAQLSVGQSPMSRAESFSLHDIIDPAETRSMLCNWIDRIKPILPTLLGPTSFPTRP